MTTAAKARFTVDQVVSAIQNGVMPDGGDIHDDEAYLNALAAALDTLSSKDHDAVMHAVGCNVAAAEATADQLAQLGSEGEEACSALVKCTHDRDDGMIYGIIDCEIIGSYVDDPVFGFSLVHEVAHGTLCDRLRDYGAVVYLKPQESRLLSELNKSQEIKDNLTIMQKILNDQFPSAIDHSNEGIIRKLSQLQAASERDRRRADGD